MTPWLRWWFPHGDDAQGTPPPPDAALWSPEAIMQTQREMWQHSGQSLQQWWGWWRSAWPSLPLLPPVGVLQPPPQSDAMPPTTDATTVADATPGDRGSSHRGAGAARRPKVGHKPAASVRARPRRAVRGK